ncbi:MAG: hypothetical protein IT470_06130 [Pseudomonadales bacterium]|nr:hypothetical protein [Pseudomonadales bacterium]
MSKRKNQQEESYETAEGFQIEDMEGNPVEDEPPAEDEAAAAHSNFWDEDEDEDDEEQEEDEYFSSVAENSNWEEGYDY